MLSSKGDPTLPEDSLIRLVYAGQLDLLCKRLTGPQTPSYREARALAFVDALTLAPPFFEAVTAGDIRALRDFWRRGFRLDGLFWNEETPLMAAAGAGQLASVDWLLAHGADPNRVIGRTSALTLAARGGHLGCFGRLYRLSSLAIRQRASGEFRARVHGAC